MTLLMLLADRILYFTGLWIIRTLLGFVSLPNQDIILRVFLQSSFKAVSTLILDLPTTIFATLP